MKASSWATTSTALRMASSACLSLTLRASHCLPFSVPKRAMRRSNGTSGTRSGAKSA